MKYAQWALERDEVLATKIFTERESESEVLSPHRVLDYLKVFPVATVSYLEHVIRHKGSKVNIATVLLNQQSHDYHVIFFRRTPFTLDWPTTTSMM